MTRAKDKKKTGRSVQKGAAVAIVALSSLSVFRAVAATATLPILAHIIRAIQISVNTSMDFGTVAVTGEAAAQATLDPYTSSLRVEGEGGLVLAGGVPKAGRLMIKGAPMAVHLSLETNLVHLTNGQSNLTIRDFNFGTAHRGPEATVTPTGPDNAAFITLGASLQAKPRQLTGNYVGSTTIFANYQ